MLRTYHEFYNLFMELLGEPDDFNIWRHGICVLHSYCDYYKYDFTKFGTNLTLISLRNNFSKFECCVLLFDQNFKYVGYCVHSKKLFVREAHPTFY